MDPGRIERLRSQERVKSLNPIQIWETLLGPASTEEECVVVDIGTGVGYFALPFAERHPKAKVYGFDVLEGMIALLKEDAKGIDNLDARIMRGPFSVELPDNRADLVVMIQVHHELDEPVPLLRECKRILKPGGILAIIDWKDEDNGKSPPAGRRVPEARIREEMGKAGFFDDLEEEHAVVQRHDIFQYHQFLTVTKVD